MSDSVKKYYEMMEDRTQAIDDVYCQVQIAYTELQLVETVAKLARHYREIPSTLLLKLAQDELAVQRVCD